MANINVKGRMKVKTLQNEMKDAFGVTLRMYKGVKFADPGDTLASIRIKGVKIEKGAELKVVGNMNCGSFEKKIKKIFGIKVQVADSKNENLAPDDITLSSAGKL
jgi:hypothetical protein